MHIERLNHYEYKIPENSSDLLKEYEEKWEKYRESEQRSQVSASYEESYCFSPIRWALNKTISSYIDEQE